MRSLSSMIPLVLAVLARPAWAGEISSAYTELDWAKTCVTYAQAKEGDGDRADLACAGYRGYPVLISYDDERESLFYGFPAADMTPVWESFSAFNASAPKIEWRIETTGEIAVPFAAIHRRTIAASENPDSPPTEVLAVMKVAQPDARDGCTVGLVLATGNPHANEQAREIADEKARTFQCGRDKRTVVGAVPDFGRVDN